MGSSFRCEKASVISVCIRQSLYQSSGTVKLTSMATESSHELRQSVMARMVLSTEWDHDLSTTRPPTGGVAMGLENVS